MHAVWTGFSHIEIKQLIFGRVSYNTVVDQAILVDVAPVAHPVKPGTVGVTQADRLAVIQGRDGGSWRGLIGRRRRQFPEPHQRVGARSCTDSSTHKHMLYRQIYHRIDGSLIRPS